VSVGRHRILAYALVLAVGLSACGNQPAHPHVADANNNGVYVDAGPVTYQLQISRELNQYGTEDSQYVKGLPPGTAAPTPDEFWYGVFMWAKNQTSRTQVTTDNFDIVDTQGNRYYPLKLIPALNPYAWTAQTLKPLNTEPGPDTTAAFGPTQGGLLLFKLNSSAYANRPLTLEIRGPSNQLWATISLDL
jgi:hypothetical protein